jgi:hypothetical protein
VSKNQKTYTRADVVKLVAVYDKLLLLLFGHPSAEDPLEIQSASEDIEIALAQMGFYDD